MALRIDEVMEAERERIQPHVEQLTAIVRRVDPEARFTLHVGHDPGFWELNAYVRPELIDDPELGRLLAHEATDIHLEHDVAIVVIPLARRD